MLDTTITNEILKYVEDGFSSKRIGDYLQLPTNIVQMARDQFKMSIQREVLTNENRAVELYTRGVSLNSLAYKFDINKYKLTQLLLRNGVKIKNKVEAIRNSHINENYFDTIDTKEKAYWYGFISNTIYISHNPKFISLTLKKQQLDRLQQLSLLLLSNINNGDKSGQIKIFSQHLVNKLSLLVNNDFVNYIEYNLYSYFIRGYFDANAVIDGGRLLLKINNIHIDSFCKYVKIISNVDFDINGGVLAITDKCLYIKLLNIIYNTTNVPVHLAKFVHNKFKEQGFFTTIASVGEHKITAKYLKTLPKEQREELVDPLFSHFRTQGWQYPNLSDEEINKEYSRIVKFNINLNNNVINNNKSIGTKLCKYFCAKSYYNSVEGEGNWKPIVELWDDDKLLKEVIRNRLGIKWFDLRPDEVYNMSHRILIQGFKNSRSASLVSIFKPEIAKYIALRYSQIGDVIGDYSCGFGGRLLGAMSAGRKYIGTDPLTVPELREMVTKLNFNDNCKLIHCGSENYRGDENSIDLYWSSPPYYTQEIYSGDETQANINGEEHFYNVYWSKTLNNIKFMLKSNKWFGLNVSNNEKMLEMAKELFGDIVERIELQSTKSPLTTKIIGETKSEYIYMFKNNK